MCSQTKVIVWLSTLVVVAGCATVNPRPDYERAAREVSQAVGHESVYQPGDEEIVARKVTELLDGGITANEASQLCLLNNPRLQAAFMDVGVARAELVQSGLLSNPTLGMSLELPEGGGRSNIQASIAQNIADLWQIPVRQSGAERKLDEAILKLAREATELATDTKTAYYAAVGADQTLTIARGNQELSQQLLDIAVTKHQAGAVGVLDVSLARTAVLKAELNVRTARLDADTARSRLATLCGLTLRARELVLTEPLPHPAIVRADMDRLVELARTCRLDICAADQTLAAARSRIEEEYRKVFPSIEVGAALERNERRALPGRKIIADTARASVANGALTAPEIQSRSARRAERRAEIDAILGPSISLTLPVFDQNQAQIAKAKFEYELALKTRLALEQSVIQETRQAVDKAVTALDSARFYGGDILPQAQSALEMSRESYRAGTTSFVVVLEAQQSFQETRQGYVTALQVAAEALVELERAIGRPIATFLSEEVGPTTQPSSTSQGAPQASAP